MGGSDFNATTSKVEATGQPGFLTGPSTMCGLFLPDGAGESNIGCMLATHATTTPRRRFFVSTASMWLRQVVLRTTTSADFTANTRALATTGALTAKNGAFCAATFDSTQTPNSHLYNSCDGTNAGEVAECGYSGTTAGAGTVNAGDTTYSVGNVSLQSQTWDGGIAWAAFIPAVITLNEMQALAAGVNPVAVVGHYTDVRIVDLTDFANPREMTDNAVTWTATAVAANEAILLPAGDGFATNGILTRP